MPGDFHARRASPSAHVLPCRNPLRVAMTCADQDLAMLTNRPIGLVRFASAANSAQIAKSFPRPLGTRYHRRLARRRRIQWRMLSVPGPSPAPARSDVRLRLCSRSTGAGPASGCPECGGDRFRARAPATQAARGAPRHARARPAGWARPESDDTARRLPCVRRRDRAEVVALEPGWTRVGRSLSADLRFDDPTVSRRHALVYREPGGRRAHPRRPEPERDLPNGERVDLAELRTATRSPSAASRCSSCARAAAIPTAPLSTTPS